jgi:hypothetical protein
MQTTLSPEVRAAEAARRERLIRAMEEYDATFDVVDRAFPPSIADCRRHAHAEFELSLLLPGTDCDHSGNAVYYRGFGYMAYGRCRVLKFSIGECLDGSIAETVRDLDEVGALNTPPPGWSPDLPGDC